MLTLVPIRQQDWSCNLKLNLEDEDAVPFIVGRNKDLAIPVEETAISRKHAELSKDEENKICLKALRKVWLKRGKARKISTVAGGEVISVSHHQSFAKRPRFTTD